MRRTLMAAVLGWLALTSDGRAEWLRRPAARPFSWADPNCPNCLTPPGAPMPEAKSDPAPSPSPMPAPAPAPEPSFSPFTSAALGDSFTAMTAPGYLDPAAPMNVIRFRADQGYHIDRPDRAEFFYAKCGCFPGAPGPRLPERSADYQDYNLYLEIAPSARFSGFVEAGVRSLNPDVNENATGFNDLRLGFKYAILRDDDRILTFQLRTFLPTGEADRGLGTNHVSLEPSLLFWRRLNERLALHAQVGDWIPVGGEDFAGNVLNYGVGLSYAAVDTGRVRISPIVELLGWSVLDGFEFSTLNRGTGIRDAGGITVVNGKFGVRFEAARHDFYVGYGHALTNDIWYREILRFEYRLKF